jgi:putative aldouronate transport system permease protein
MIKKQLYFKQGGEVSMNKYLDKDKLLEMVFISFTAIMSVAAIVPFILVLSSSFTDEMTLVRQGYNLFPEKFSLDAYKLIFNGKLIFNAYKVTIFVTVVGTLLSLIVTSGLAYGIICKSIKHRDKIAFFIYFTMLFNGGLVPMYLLISKYLHMKDTIWVLIVPVLVNPWNLFLLRNFFSGIPESIIESARIDGANDIRILFRIILPISLPGIATIGLFYALAYWNEWFRALLFISDRL